ncbi:MAG: alpha/beta hydrolase [Myxococcales bacterium]|nr:alpha/beta hydrolase [Myxococcales bacterium]
MNRAFKIGAIVLGSSLGLLGIFIGVLYLVSKPAYQLPKTVSDDASLPQIDLNGTRFHCLRFGSPDRPPVIVVHGGPGADSRYLLGLKALADRYYVIFYDQRGSGLSARVPSAQLTAEQALDDLHAMVTHFGRGRPVRLIGHSFGAMLVAAYLGRHPQQVAQAVLAEPGFLTPAMGDELFKATNGFLPPMTARTLWLIARTFFESRKLSLPDDDAADDYFVQKLIGVKDIDLPTKGYFCGETIRPELTTVWRMGGRAARLIARSGMDAEGKHFVFDFSKNLKTFPRKVLLVASSCNRLIGVVWQKRHLPLFHDVQLVVIPNAGHYMVAENPTATLAAIRQYFRN